MTRRVLILLLLASLFLVGKAIAQDSSHVAIGSLAAWDIEFHVITSKGEYLQDLRNPYDEGQRALGIFSGGRLAAYYLWVHGKCFTALPSRRQGAPTILVNPTSCRMYTYFSELIWQYRVSLGSVPLESPLPPNKANGTDY